MGCYDTVTFRCPKCGTRLSNQSKAGPCDLLSYSEFSVPLVIAAGMSGDDVECRECDRTWVVRAEAPPTIRLSLEEPPGDDDCD